MQRDSADSRAWVGPSETYDVMGALQFNLLTGAGMRADQTLLDIGCGSLRAGRLFVTYLSPGNYFGIEPEEWLIDEARADLGDDFFAARAPHFSSDSTFTLSAWERQFDFLLAQSVFSHASEEQIRRCLSEARKVMHDESLFFMTFKAGDYDYREREWVYPGCVPYRESSMVGFAADAGLACRMIDWPHPNQLSWALIADARAPIPPGLAENVLAVAAQRDQLADELKRLRKNPVVRYGRLARSRARMVRKKLRRR